MTMIFIFICQVRPGINRVKFSVIHLGPEIIPKSIELTVFLLTIGFVNL